MLRQASSRNHRSKGFRVKHALQIGLLVAICIWLLYQVKHSHEKKRALIERNANILNNIADKKEDFFKFGRKDLPNIEETHKEEEENEETQDEEVEDHPTKQEEIENEEEKGATDDDIDEQDQDKGDEDEIEHEEKGKDNYDDNDNADNENDNAEIDNVNDNGNGNEEEKDEHGEVDVFHNQEHEGGTQEAREENYKRDDASSAVVHNDHTTESETGAIEAKSTDEDPVVDKIDYDSDANASKGANETHMENVEKNVLELESATNGTYESTKREVVPETLERKAEESENLTNETTVVNSLNNVNDSINSVSAKDAREFSNNPANATIAENEDREAENTGVNVSVSNSTITEYNSEQQTNSTNQVEAQNNLVTANATASNDISVADSAQGINNSNNNTSVSEDMVQSQNAPNVVDESANNTNVGGDKIESQNGLGFSANNETTAKDELESKNVVNPDENINTTTSSTNENGDTAKGESENSSNDGITDEERDARVDISILPDIQNEILKTSDDEAATAE